MTEPLLPRLGLLPHGKADHELLRVQLRVDQIAYPPACDHMAGVTPGMDGNDRFGVCGPTSVDNHNRITTKVEDGSQVDATQEQVFDLYRASGNPDFDPATGADDNGVSMPVMMDALRKVGLGGKKIAAYGRLANTSDRGIYAAIELFGAVLFAVDLQTAQQGAPVWDYQPSGVWGGHAVVAGAYDSTAGTVDVFSWATRIPTTAAFRAHQLSEVWVPIWSELVTTDKFAQGVDVPTLARDFTLLTGATFPGAVTPKRRKPWWMFW